MKEFIVTALDKPNASAVRAANRAAHLAHIAVAKNYGVAIIIAGPLLADDGAMLGSHLILGAADKKNIDDFLADDPYRKAGLFASVTIHNFKKVLP
ncbi:MAG: YciI family protein [Hydrotalea sp.]|nr:YciI family protein [Hydrotalea sp.]